MSPPSIDQRLHKFQITFAQLFREGRPKKFNQQQINLAMNLLKDHSYKEVEKMTGISKSTLTRNKKKMQLSTEV